MTNWLNVLRGRGVSLVAEFLTGYPPGNKCCSRLMRHAGPTSQRRPRTIRNRRRTLGANQGAIQEVSRCERHNEPFYSFRRDQQVSPIKPHMHFSGFINLCDEAVRATTYGVNQQNYPVERKSCRYGSHQTTGKNGNPSKLIPKTSAHSPLFYALSVRRATHEHQHQYECNTYKNRCC